MVHGWQPQTPEQSFKSKSGICRDGALFAKDALQQNHPGYQECSSRGRARPSFGSHPLEWMESYIMDYAAGSNWRSMMGVHTTRWMSYEDSVFPCSF